jgi:beta-N-acetylhexosaminidase
MDKFAPLSAGLQSRDVLALALASLAMAAAPDPTAGLTTRQLAGQRLVTGFAGTSAPKPLLRRIRRGELGGVIVFGANIRSRPQLRTLTRSLQRARPAHLPPLIVAIDQEGGQVKRLSGAPTLSPPQLGARNDPALARRQGVATAKNLRSVGVNVDLAPVLDVARPGSIMERQRRSYSRSAGRVKRIGGAFLGGLTAGGVGATGKHFPGLGAATKNQDLEVNRITTPLTQLRSVDELPYTGVQPPLVMVSSAIYPALSEKPAVFSRHVVVDELRRRIGFGGVTISDAVDAPAMARYGSQKRRALLAARAGVDLLLFSGAGPTPSDELGRDRVAARRVLELRASFPG